MPHAQVEEQVSTMLDAGINEIILSGVDIGAYNDDGFGLEDLCESLSFFWMRFPGWAGMTRDLPVS